MLFPANLVQYRWCKFHCSDPCKSLGIYKVTHRYGYVP